MSPGTCYWVIEEAAWVNEASYGRTDQNKEEYL